MKEQKIGTSATETITMSRAEYTAQKEQIAERSQKVDWLMEQLRLSKRKRFGPSSEQAKEQPISGRDPAVQKMLCRIISP